MTKKTINKPKQPVKQVIKKIDTKKMYIYLGLILLVTALVFSNSIMHDFLSWDDNLLVPENYDIKAITMHNISKIFTSYYIGMYQPVTTFIYAITYHFFKLNPHPYHVVNLVFHLVNVGLLFWLIYLMTERIEAAAIVALFFGIHPMHVESVVWIAELKDIIYGLFFILALCYYMMFLKKGKYVFYFLAIFSFILSCFSKSAAVTLPVVLIAFDYYLKPVNFKPLTFKYWLYKAPFFIISLIFGIVSLRTQASEKAIVDITPLFSIVDRFFLVCYSTSFYIVRLFLPIKLSTLHYYPLNPGKALPAIYYLSPLPLILISILILIKKNYRKLLIFGLLFFLITIALVLQIIPVGQALVAERYTYIPYIGLLFIIGKLYSDVADNKVKNAAKIKPYFTGILIVFAMIFCYTTYERNKVWTNTVVLFTDVIDKDPGIFYSYTVRGGALILDKKYKEGIEDYEESIRLQPNYFDPYFSIGKAYYYLGEYGKAISYYSKAIELKPDFAEAYSNRAAVYFNTNNIQGTIEDCNKAIALKPQYPDAYINRGNAKGVMKDYEGSIEDFDKGLAIKPDLAEGYVNRGLSKFFLGRKDAACSDFRFAYSLGDSNAVNFIKKYCN